MKKLVLGLMLVMGLSLVGCGNAKDEVVNGGGFTPSKPSTETVVETEKEEINLEMTVEEMKEYYNDNQFVGTPSCEVWKVKQWGPVTKINRYLDDGNFPISFEQDLSLEDGKSYICIITDNGTPDDYSDDELAYIFTTPIEE